MDFHRYVREHLRPLAIAREPEIVDELARHLGDLYQEALAAGATPEAALARALASLPGSAELARDIESANRALPGLIANRWRNGSMDLLGARAPRWLSSVARLKPGTTIPESLAAMDVVARRLQAAYPDTNLPRAFSAVPLGEGPGVRASSRPLLRLLAGSVLLVLLIACANVASLLLARSVSRRREVAVRIPGTRFLAGRP